MDSDAADFLEGLNKVGIRPDQVRAILLTHWHNDHSAGAAFLQRSFGARVYYTAAERPYLTRESATGGFRRWLGKRVPEAGVLVLLRGLLEEAAPEAVTADHFLSDGDLVEEEFRALITPGHTRGHVAYFHEPTEILFCGDALAVVGKRLRLMARPVTPDLPSAETSAVRCLGQRAKIMCPGHRIPLTENVKEECLRLRNYLEAGGRWPLLG
jgi:glyoxylase-like metal-dependent hydrolase (beta-lactamase superfamily II)